MLSYASRSSVHCAPLLRCKCIDTWPFSSVPVSLFPSPLCTGITGQTEALHCYCASTQSALTMRTTPTTLTQHWHGLIFQRYTARDTIGRMRRRKNCNQANWVWEGNEKWKWIVVERGKKNKEYTITNHSDLCSDNNDFSRSLDSLSEFMYCTSTSLDHQQQSQQIKRHRLRDTVSNGHVIIHQHLFFCFSPFLNTWPTRFVKKKRVQEATAPTPLTA